MNSHDLANALPGHCLQWLVSSRLRFVNDMKEGKPLKYFSAHLPVMATWPQTTTTDQRYPVNMTVKGIGLIPRYDQLARYTAIFEEAAATSRTLTPSEGMVCCVEAMGRLYADESNFDPALLGGLEIFGGKTLENLTQNGYASLLYVGMQQGAGPMSYISFQVNGKIEILDTTNPHYRFLLASRKLFEHDKFHLYQPDYPHGYLIRVEEVIDKSPWSKLKKDT
ncbi:pyridoxamine 5'-phosphate oxidase-like FMN-binding protein [Candidatus Magnetobacterium bavaricum]|uniref:Pyridoxamine 5'-phosphate oxidase-like FMN-binding protein n=1 Tax=Candidatus Magnetobacterium bavaricum TaxID=29290 RepID=A0A0F3GT88_9BACT|nr:pyridoxamine 5'-phosphate oxidase-like FMN-binding protein [Candidatus Magnetobacterium bavaricum]